MHLVATQPSTFHVEIYHQELFVVASRILGWDTNDDDTVNRMSAEFKSWNLF
jgi:hypothetical protein